jgi:hypothetical protein
MYPPALDPKPIDTIRLVPYPHQPHSIPGSRFEAPAEEPPDFSALVLFNMSLPVYGVDRKTDLHDGVESYIRLGRLRIIKEERGKKFADLLINAALD